MKALLPGVLLVACASEPTAFTSRDGGVDAAARPDGGDAASDIAPVPVRDGSNMMVGDPTTCEHAAASRTYVGCDFWPTVLPNVVGTCFHYAVVVANPGDTPAEDEGSGEAARQRSVAS